MDGGRHDGQSGVGVDAAADVSSGSGGPPGSPSSGGPTDVAGVRVGHWTDPVARTGCTVVLLPGGTVVSGEVRGSAPATREWALLSPERTVSEAHALVLTGGSAFGLSVADGVMGWLSRRGEGFLASGHRVPIVPTLAVFDLSVGDGTVRPGPAAGEAACEAAEAASSPGGAPVVLVGPVGAGAGCTVGKWHDPAERLGAGLGAATVVHGDLVVTALVALNAAGYVGERRLLGPPAWAIQGLATTIGAIVTNAALDKVGCFLVAQSGHDGLARAIDPVHTGMDGDALFSAATGEVTVTAPGGPRPPGREADAGRVADAGRAAVPLDLVRALAARVVEDAVRSVPLTAVAPSSPG